MASIGTIGRAALLSWPRGRKRLEGSDVHFLNLQLETREDAIAVLDALRAELEAKRLPVADRTRHRRMLAKLRKASLRQGTHLP
jgi:hypothetical protein